METFEQIVEKQIQEQREKLKQLSPDSKEAGEIQKRINDLTNTLLWWNNN